ncbi:MAG: hypothetical protein CME59_22650 [Halioglobus sp.]|nr:hypothetical protein [Halioglobus sp.]|tara:strand:- start:2068 stop:3783 length:1716 start_codon:yes stop_codon:yes gene_type:complete
MASRTRKKNRWRAIPTIAGASPDVQAIREVIEVMTGARGDELNRVLTYGDLLDADILQLIDGGISVRPPGDPTIPPITPPPSGTPTVERPTQPTGFDATGTFSAVNLYWDQAPYYGHAYTEVWRSQTDEFGTAVLIATVTGRFFSDPVNPGQVFYYWVRFVNVSGQKGPLHALGGFYAETATPVTEIIQSMQDLLQPDDLAQSLQDDIQVGLAVETFLEANWSIESAIDNGGNVRVTGMKLINGQGDLSKIIFNTDVFAVAPPFDPQSDEEGEAIFVIGPYTHPITQQTTNKVIITSAAIGDLTVGEAAIQELRADKITVGGIPGNPSSIAEVIIGSGHIDDAMIGNYIQSSDWNPTNKTGWKLGRGGVEGTTFEAFGAAFKLYDSGGNVIIDAGGNSYAAAIANINQDWYDVQNQPFPLTNSPGPSNIGTYIANAAVGTLLLGNDILVVPTLDEGGSGNVGPGQQMDLCTISITVPNVGQGLTQSTVMITWYLAIVGSNSNDPNMTLRLYRGAQLWSQDTEGRDDFLSGVWMDTRPPGTWTYVLRLDRTSANEGTIQVLSSAMVAALVKK